MLGLMAWHKMQSVAIDGVAWSVSLSVCLSVGHVREPCKKAEPIEMPFGWGEADLFGSKEPCIRWYF